MASTNWKVDQARCREGSRREERGDKLTERADLTETLEGLKDGAYCKCGHMSTCNTVRCACGKVDQKCVNFRRLGQCTKNHPPRTAEKKQLKAGGRGGEGGGGGAGGTREK